MQQPLCQPTKTSARTSMVPRPIMSPPTACFGLGIFTRRAAPSARVNLSTVSTNCFYRSTMHQRRTSRICRRASTCGRPWELFPSWRFIPRTERRQWCRVRPSTSMWRTVPRGKWSVRRDGILMKTMQCGCRGIVGQVRIRTGITPLTLPREIYRLE